MVAIATDSRLPRSLTNGEESKEKGQEKGQQKSHQEGLMLHGPAEASSLTGSLSALVQMC
jgi:hypothetical protein